MFQQMLRKLAAQSNYRPGLAFFQEAWRALVGGQMADHSHPSGWDGHTLEVAVHDNWHPTMSLMRSELLSHLRRQLPWKVAELVFVAQHDLTCSNRQVIRPMGNRNVRVTMDWPDDCCDDLDPELRNILLKIRSHNR